MKILMTGATGFIGRRLAARLVEAGHSLVVVSRDPAGAAARAGVPCDAIGLDAVAPGGGALPRVDAVVHLLGEPIASGRWTEKRKRAIRESRVGGTRRLIEALGASKARPAVFVSASAVGYYGDRGDELLTEAASTGSDFLAEVCRGWEQEASRASTLGARVVMMRTGIVLGPGGGALREMLPAFRLGLGGPLGS